MPTPTMNEDYTFRYLDSGIELNGAAQSEAFGYPGCFVDVTSISGLDVPEIRTTFEDYTDEHGGYVEARYLKHRVIGIEGVAYGPGDILHQYMKALAANFFPTVNPLFAAFHMKLPGEPQSFILAKSLGLKYDITREYSALHRCVFQAQLVAEDPRKYYEFRQVEIPMPGALAPGVSLPLSFPINFDKVVTSTGVTFQNDGTWPDSTPAVLKIKGPVTNPIVKHHTLNKTMSFILSIPSNKTLVVDLGARTVTMDGQNLRHTMSGPWWMLRKGSNTISFTSSHGVNASAVLLIEYRPAGV